MRQVKTTSIINGFTLVEMVTVILVLGILVVGVSSFIIFGTRIFVESSSVDQVLSQSRFVIERMTREIRSSVPNTPRILTATDGSYQCVEFVPATSSTTYVEAPVAPAALASQARVIITSQAISPNQQAIVYPQTTAEVYGASSTTAKRLTVDTVAVSGDEVTLGFSVPSRFSAESPIKRIFFAEQPVSYCLESQGTSHNIVRYQNYGYHQNQLSPSGLQSQTGVSYSLMGQDVVNALLIEPAIILTPSNLMTNAMIHLEPRFSVNGETFKYQHQVQVMNVP